MRIVLAVGFIIAAVGTVVLFVMAGLATDEMQMGAFMLGGIFLTMPTMLLGTMVSDA